MSLRDPGQNDLPPPYYYPGQPLVTIVIYHGGQFSNPCSMRPTYIGGSVSKFDNVKLHDVGFDYIDKLSERLGYMGLKRYYNLEEHGFVLIKESHHVLQLCLLHQQDREVPIYLDASLHDLSSQVGTSGVNFDVPVTECEAGTNDESSEHEDFEDSDYAIDNDEYDQEQADNTLYEINVDEGVEYEGTERVENNAYESESEEEVGEVLSDSSDFDSGKDSDDENGENFPVFSVQDTYTPNFKLGMYFSNKAEFRKAIHSHAVNTRRNLKITKNDKRRIYAKCAWNGCEWRIHCLALSEESNSFQIREYHPRHNCGDVYHVKNCKSGWLGDKYVDSFKTDPKRNVKGFRQDIVHQINVHVSKNQAYRCKWKALKNIEGSTEDQYGKLWDYAEELRTSNPGSTVIMSVTQENLFARFYVCFKGVKDGFMSGCRPVIGVDGCHLKGPHGGLLLAAVGIDPDNNSYPICYAVVDKETKATWEWFLRLLKHDLNIERDYEWTFMSDKQKGLIPAFETVFPTSDNRFCVRHLFGNMTTSGFKGAAYKKALWKAAMATTVSEFEARMKEMIKLDKKMVEWLNDKPPMQWSKSHFKTYPKCDMLLNNLCESFNSSILEAREKQIYSMLELIREWMLTRMQENRDQVKRSRRWRGKICPKIKGILKKRGERVKDCIPMKSTDQLYEVECYDLTKCAVDLANWTCSCRKWELSGIPCKHALSVIYTQGLDPEDFVHQCYHVETYMKVYAHFIHPVKGCEKWAKTGKEGPLPPNFGRGVGRPPRARRLGADEPRDHQKKNTRGNKKQSRMKRQQASLRCRFCGETGHNMKTCKKKKEQEEQGAQPEQEEQGAAKESNLQEEVDPSTSALGINASQQHLDDQIWEQVFDWGERTDWGQIPNFESFVQEDSQPSEPAPEVAVLPSQEATKLTARKRTKVRQQEVEVVKRSKICSSFCNFEIPKEKTASKKTRTATPENQSFVFGPVPTTKFGPTRARGQVPTPNCGPIKKAKGPISTPNCGPATRPRGPPFKVIEKHGKKFVTVMNLTAAFDTKRAENMEKLKGKKKTI